MRGKVGFRLFGRKFLTLSTLKNADTVLFFNLLLTLSFLILWWKEIETEDMETGTEVFPTFVPHPSLWIERVQTSFGLFCLHCKQYFYF